MNLISKMILALLLGVPALGCTTVRETQPPRTATEQVLLSYSIQDSIRAWDLSELDQRRIFVDDTHFESIDEPFVIGQIREHVGASGAILTAAEDEAEVRLEVRSAGVGINKKDVLLGLPSFPVPILSAGTFVTPELALLKTDKQAGLSAIAVTAFDTATGRRLFGIDPAVGKTRRLNVSVLGLPVVKRRDNMPEAYEE